MKRERTEIAAALSLRWSTSPVEGQINRLKLIKRKMFGRAGIELLRKRVLYSDRRENLISLGDCSAYFPCQIRITYAPVLRLA